MKLIIAVQLGKTPYARSKHSKGRWIHMPLAGSWG